MTLSIDDSRSAETSTVSLNPSQLIDESSCLAELNEAQTSRLTALLDQYLCQLEQGEPVDIEKMLRDNDDIADVLRAYFVQLDELHGIAAGFQQGLFGDSDPETVVGENARLGDYTIVREIGRGGMGIVFEAVQESLNRRVALKLLPMTAMLDARQIARFKNESLAAGQLQHRHIVSVHGVGVERGIHYYAMQLIDGSSVDAWISERRQVASSETPTNLNGSSSASSGPSQSMSSHLASSWREAVRLTVDAAEALDHAHDCGIVHRDIKPSNLLLDSEKRIWVTDFGLARCQNALSLTRSGDLVGTMRYMSPEQAQGRAELVDHRTDIYSLAATLYEMLTLEPAVRGENGPSLLRTIGRELPVKVRKFIPDVPRDLDVVLRKAMANEKDDRYATAHEFANDLRAVLAGRATVAKPPTYPTIVGRAIIRHHRLVTVATIVTVLAAIGLLANTIVIAQKNWALNEQTARANLSFKQARDTVDHLGVAVAEQLAMVPGGERVRQSVLRATLDYYRRFVVDSADDANFKAVVARTHSRIGSLVRELDTPQQSVVHFERSESKYRELLETDPAPMLRRERAMNLNQLGLAWAESSQPERAEQSYRQAIAIQSELFETMPESSEFETDLALTKSNLGLLFQQTGRPGLSRVQVLSAVASLERAVLANGENVVARRALSAALTNLSALTINSDPQEAVKLLERAIDQQVESSERLPNPLRASAEIATTYSNLGSAELAAHHPDRAVDAFEHAITLQRQLAKLSPWIRRYKLELAVSLNNLAKAEQSRRNFGVAERKIREAIQLQTVCVGLDSDDPIRRAQFASGQSRLGAMHNNLGHSLRALGDNEASALAFQQAIEIQRAAIRSDPDNATFKSYLTQHFAELLDLEVQQQQWERFTRTAHDYVRVAAGDPQLLLHAAEDLAQTTDGTPKGGQRQRTISLVAATLVSARKAGLVFDETILQRHPFDQLADSTILRKAVRQ